MYISCPVFSWWLGQFPSDSLADGFLAWGSWSDQPYRSHSIELNGILAVSPWKFSSSAIQGYQVYRGFTKSLKGVTVNDGKWFYFCFQLFFPEPVYSVCGDTAPCNVHRCRVSITCWRGCPLLTVSSPTGTSVTLSKGHSTALSGWQFVGDVICYSGSNDHRCASFAVKWYL